MPEKIEVTFLGTGDSMPTVKRNHTGILVKYRADYVLVDCGEGIQRQFKIAGISPTKITAIVITHWHGDHVLGLPGLLETLAMSNYSKKLIIYGPKGIKEKINHLQSLYGRFHLNLDVVEVSGKFLNQGNIYWEAASMSHGTPTNAYSFVIKDKIRLDKKKLKQLKLPKSPLLRQLQHGKDIMFNGKKIRSSQVSYLEKGKKITIVLDTGLNANITSLAKGADLIISESSFLSSEEQKAHEYKHLTAKQAAEIAKKAKAKKLALVHISQRYEKNFNPILAEAKKVFKNSHIVKDFDRILI